LAATTGWIVEGAEGADHPKAGQPWVVAELDGQDLGVDRGGVHRARID
jgi:hypothetical protein